MISSKATGYLPRVIADGVTWVGGCQAFEVRGKLFHGHMSAYLIVGSEKTMLVDTGSPYHRQQMLRDVEAILGGRKLDYVFATHNEEYPHVGLLEMWMERYPEAIAVGNLVDHKLLFPSLKGRVRVVKPGDEVDLGDRRLMFVPAVWRDFKDTLWAFETKSRVLFVADGFAFLHYHGEGECDHTAVESKSDPTPELFQHYGERALNWALYTDVRSTFADLDGIMSALKPNIIAGAHGPVIDNPAEVLPLAKQGLMLAGIKGGAIVPPEAGKPHTVPGWDALDNFV
jgi:flavorubredoxin